MKKLVPVLFVLILILSSCYYPADEDISQDPVVATNVAQILTQGALNRSEENDETIATPAPEELPYPVTGVGGSDAESKDPALEAENPPEAEAETPENTEEPAESTPETSVDENLPWSGTSLYSESFDSNNYWNFENPYLLSKIGNGQLEFTSKGSPWWTSYYTTKPEVQNGYYETSLNMLNCNANDRIGLVFRLKLSGDFYYMGLTCDGKWGFSQYTSDNRTIDILPYETSDALNPVSEPNQLGVLANGNDFEFYINRQKVGSATNTSLPEAGFFGFMSMSAGTQNFKTLIDRLEVWEK